MASRLLVAVLVWPDAGGPVPGSVTGAGTGKSEKRRHGGGSGGGG